MVQSSFFRESLLKKQHEQPSVEFARHLEQSRELIVSKHGIANPCHIQTAKGINCCCLELVRSL